MRADGKIEKLTYVGGRKVIREWIDPPSKKNAPKKVEKKEKKDEK